MHKQSCTLKRVEMQRVMCFAARLTVWKAKVGILLNSNRQYNGNIVSSGNYQ